MRVYDCFTFFNELDLLEIRLNILNEHVDYFVLVEATETHSGQKKELIFEKNKSRFHAFSDKIIHIIVNDMPEIKNGNRWPLENFQRNAIMRGLSNCEGGDIIIISDVDEIPDLTNMDDIKNTLKIKSRNENLLYGFYIKLNKAVSGLRIGHYVLPILERIYYHFPIKSNKMLAFEQKLYFFYLNGFVSDHWIGSKAILYKDLSTQYDSTPQQIRNSAAKKIKENGGWHFSYLFTPQGISAKIKAFAHSEFDSPEHTDIDLIKERVEKGESLFGRKEKITYVKVDDSYPDHILMNMEKYAKYINPCLSKLQNSDTLFHERGQL